MLAVLQSVGVLFALVFLGYFLGKKQVVHNTCAPELSNFLLKVTLPATVFCSMVRPFRPALLKESALLFGLMFVFHALCLLAGLAAVRLCRVPRAKAGVWLFVAMFSNNGFMGFPLAQSLYGDDGLFLMAAANVVSNFLIFSLGVRLLTSGQGVGHLSGRQLFYNNINIAVAAGLVCYLTQWSPPAFVMTVLKDIGGLTGALSMVVVGLSMSRSRVRRMFADKKMYLLAAVRLLVLPLCTVAVVHLLGLRQAGLVSRLLVLIAALPSPSSVSIIAETWRVDTEAPAQAIFLTTLFSLATIPLMLLLV